MSQDVQAPQAKPHSFTKRQLNLLERAKTQSANHAALTATLEAQQAIRWSQIQLRSRLESMAHFVESDRQRTWVYELNSDHRDLLPELPDSAWQEYMPAFAAGLLERWCQTANFMVESDQVTLLRNYEPSGPVTSLAHDLFSSVVKAMGLKELKLDAFERELTDLLVMLADQRAYMGTYFYGLRELIKPGPNPFSEYRAHRARSLARAKSLYKQPDPMPERYRLAGASFEEAMDRNPRLAGVFEEPGNKTQALQWLYGWCKDHAKAYEEDGQDIPTLQTWKRYVRKYMQLTAVSSSTG